jgi:hypothetical protein
MGLVLTDNGQVLLIYLYQLTNFGMEPLSLNWFSNDREWPFLLTYAIIWIFLLTQYHMNLQKTCIIYIDFCTSWKHLQKNNTHARK